MPKIKIFLGIISEFSKFDIFLNMKIYAKRKVAGKKTLF